MEAFDLTDSEKDQLRKAVASICNSDPFKKSPQQINFLRHVFERTISGDALALKEVALGRSLFGRGASWDPTADAIVRANASHVRRNLEAYYKKDGREDPWRIELPLRNYMLQFTKRAPVRKITIATAGVDPDRPPYVGPKPFESEQRDWFFGRKAECEKLVGFATDDSPKRVAILFSPSGAGKTSLLNTLVRTELIERGLDVLPAARVGSVTNTSHRSSLSPYTEAAIASMGEQSSREEVSGLSSWDTYFARREPSGRIVIIVDQLEEILTTPGAPSQKRAFFSDLSHVLRLRPELRIILSMREEFLMAVQRLARDLQDEWVLFPLEKLKLAAAKEAIENPAAAIGINYDPQVVDELAKQLAQIRYIDYDGQTYPEDGDFIEPLHLQLVCQALWKRLPPSITRITWLDVLEAIPASRSLQGTVKSGEAIGAFVHSALVGFCSTVFAEVAQENDFPIEMIQLGCQQFTSKSGARLMVYRLAEHTGLLPSTIADALARRQLLRLENGNGVPAFELSHDTLIEPVREQTQKADILKLRDLWGKLIAQIVGKSLACDGLDIEQLVYRLCYRIINPAGDPVRVSATVLEEEIGEGALAFLRSKGVIRTVADQQTDVELSHVYLARALLQMRNMSGHDPGPLYNAARTVFSCVSSTIVAVLFVMTSRSVLQGIHLTLTQGSGDGFVNGWFQGVIGAIDWSVFIAGGLAYWWFRFDPLATETSRQRWLIGAFVGGAGGLLGGLLVTANLLYAQSANSLFEAGWILNRERPRLSALWETGYATAMILFGVALGVSSGLGMASALHSSGWKKLMARRDERTLAETMRAARPVLLHVFRSNWYILVPLMFGAAFLNYALLAALRNPPSLARVLGECIVISLGAEGIISGLIFGIFALRTGFVIPPQGEAS